MALRTQITATGLRSWLDAWFAVGACGDSTLVTPPVQAAHERGSRC